MRIASGSSIFFASLAAITSLAAPVHSDTGNQSPRVPSSGGHNGGLTAGKRQTYAELGAAATEDQAESFRIPVRVPVLATPVDNLPSPVQSTAGETSALPLPGLDLDALHRLTIPVNVVKPVSARDLPTGALNTTVELPPALASKVPSGLSVPTLVVPGAGASEDVAKSATGNSSIPLQMVDGNLLFNPPTKKMKKRDWKHQLQARQLQKEDLVNVPPLSTPTVPDIDVTPLPQWSAPIPSDTLYHALPIATPLRISIPVQDGGIPVAPLPVDPGGFASLPRDENQPEYEDPEDIGYASDAEIAGYFHDTRWVFENL